MLFDTDVLIWLLRANPKAISLVNQTSTRQISTVNYLELMKGARNRQELLTIKHFLPQNDFEILPLTENIGHRAIIYIEEHGLKSGIGLADALIAATAVENNIPLCTCNHKDYKHIADLEIKVFHP